MPRPRKVQTQPKKDQKNKAVEDSDNENDYDTIPDGDKLPDSDIEIEESENEEEEDDLEDDYEEDEKDEDIGDDDDNCIYNYVGRRKKKQAKDKDYEDDDDYDIDILEEEEVHGVDGFVPDDERVTKPILTKYERVRALSVRTEQLAKGAKPMVNVKGSINAVEIAKKELEMRTIPLFVVRTLPNGRKEKFDINQLERYN